MKIDRANMALPWRRMLSPLALAAGMAAALLAVRPAQAAPNRPGSAIFLSVVTLDGQIVCNPSGAFSQIPGHPDYFLGRGVGIGTLDFCHNDPKANHSRGFIGLYKMDWDHHALVLQKQLIAAPFKTSTGFDITGSIDPFVARFDNNYWIAFECVAPAAVSVCVAPLASDLQSVDVSRLTVPVMGVVGPRNGKAEQIVCILSASSPVLLTHRGRLYLYWVVDPFDNAVRENKLLSRGIELVPNARGILWGAGSGGRPVSTVDPNLTTLVHDVDSNDVTADHVAALTYLTEVQGKILEVASVGGTVGSAVCRSTHDESPGCWRVAVSVASEPLARNGFGPHKVAPALVPGNVVEYPRFVVDPANRHFLMGYFLPPHVATPADHAAPLSGHGVALVPLEPSDLVKYQ